MLQRLVPFTLALVVALPDVSAAIPAFARRYGVKCRQCHDVYPKLNDFGERFRERGLRMEDEEPFDAKAWIRSIPVIARGFATRTLPEDGDGSTFGIVRAVSAGNLGRHVSYWFDDSVLLQEGDDSVRHLEPDNAWVRVDLLADNGLYAKVGRLELDLPFTQARTAVLFGYEAYFANTGFEVEGLGSFREGVEVGGYQAGFHWSVAAVKSANDVDDLREAAPGTVVEEEDSDGGVYLRLAYRFGRHRVGLFGLGGSSPLAFSHLGADGRPVTLIRREGVLRVGGDVSLRARDVAHVFGAVLYGRNDDALHPALPSEAQSFTSGFLQVDWRVREQVRVTARGAFVSLPLEAGGDRETSATFYPGIQLWPWQHLKLSFEYALRDDARSDGGVVQAELAF